MKKKYLVHLQTIHP